MGGGGGLGGIASGLIGGVTGLIAANNLPQNTFGAQAPDIQKQDIVSQLNALTPQQHALTKMLMAQAQGQGPNPAQQMLQQATNRNIQQTAGAIASARGLSPALAARLIAQQGSQAGQQAAGQGALMGAQQQIAAQNALSQNLLSQQGTLQQAQAAQNAAITQGSLGAQGINAGVSSQNAQNRVNAFGGAMQGFGAALGGGTSSGGGGGGAAGAGGLLGFLYKGGQVPNYADGGDVSWMDLFKQSGGTTMPTTNAFAPMRPAGKTGNPVMSIQGNPLPSVDISQKGSLSPIGQTETIKATQDPFIMSPVGGPALARQAAWSGGVMGYDDGGNVPPIDPDRARDVSDSFKRALGFSDGGQTPSPTPAPPPIDPDRAREVSESFKHVFAKGGKVPAMLSPGEVYIPPDKVPEAAQGNPLKEGKKVPGKPKKKGNHPENDTFPAELEVGGVVIPNSVTQADSPEAKARQFMKELSRHKEKHFDGGMTGAPPNPGLKELHFMKALQGKMNADIHPKGFQQVLQARQHLQNAHDSLKKALKGMKI